MSKSPCLNCNDRHTACHDSCERYHEMKIQRATVAKKIREEKQFAIPAVNTIIRAEKFLMGGVR